MNRNSVCAFCHGYVAIDGDDGLKCLMCGRPAEKPVPLEPIPETAGYRGRSHRDRLPGEHVPRRGAYSLARIKE